MKPEKNALWQRSVSSSPGQAAVEARELLADGRAGIRVTVEAGASGARVGLLTLVGDDDVLTIAEDVTGETRRFASADVRLIRVT